MSRSASSPPLACIWGIGLPVGLALRLAVLAPYWWAIQQFITKQQASGDRGIISYMQRVYSACGRFIRS